MTVKIIFFAILMALMIPNAVALEIDLSDMEREEERPMPEMRLEKINSSAALLTITNPTERLIIALVNSQIWSPSDFSIVNSTSIYIEAGKTYEEIYHIETRAPTINIEVEIFQYLYDDFTIVPISPQEDRITLISYKKLLIKTITDYESLLFMGLVGSLILLFLINRRKEQPDD